MIRWLTLALVAALVAVGCGSSTPTATPGPPEPVSQGSFDLSAANLHREDIQEGSALIPTVPLGEEQPGTAFADQHGLLEVHSIGFGFNYTDIDRAANTPIERSKSTRSTVALYGTL